MKWQSYSFSNNLGIIRVVQEAFRFLNIPFTSSYLKRKLEDNAVYPDIRSVQETFEEYLVPNLLTRLEYEQLIDVRPYAVILLLENVDKQGVNRVRYGLLLEATDNHIKYFSDGNVIMLENAADFRSKWSGLSLLLKRSVNSGEPGYFKNKATSYLLSTIKLLACLCLLSTLLMRGEPFRYLILKLLVLVSSISGLWHAFSIYKLEEGLGFNNESYNKCNIYEGFDCLKVLNSKWGKLWGILRLSFFGILHFLVVIMFALDSVFSGGSNNSVLFYILFFPVAFVPFSLLTQKFLVRSWCVNCLKVLLSLFANFIISVFLFELFPPVNLSDAVMAALVYCGIAVTLYYLDPVIYRNYQFRIISRELYWLKSDPRVMSALLFERTVETAPPKGIKMFLGDDTANEVTLVLSPYCPSCGNLVNEIRHTYSLNQVHCQLNLLICSPKYNKEKNEEAARMLIKLLSKIIEQDERLNLLVDWYSHQDIKLLVKKYDSHVQDPYVETDSMIDSCNAFLKKIMARQTPLVLLYNKLVSPRYSFTDLINNLK